MDLQSNSPRFISGMEKSSGKSSIDYVNVCWVSVLSPELVEGAKHGVTQQSMMDLYI